MPGSGAAGRVTIQDFEKFIANLEQHKLSQASSMRVAVADAMRRSWTRPLATVALPVCFDPLLAIARRADPKPGPALYALRALALALAENSAPAGRLIGNKIVHPSAIDVGFAVEAEDGVLVPVIRNAETAAAQGSGRTATTNWSSWRASASCRPDATGGSIATVTNFGTFGLTWATPIPLPEQTLVLGMGAARRVPNWDAKGPVCAGDGSQPDAELRSSRARWRRRRPVAGARGPIAARAGKAVTPFVKGLSSLPTQTLNSAGSQSFTRSLAGTGGAAGSTHHFRQDGCYRLDFFQG